MSRLAEVFARARAQGRCACVPFLVAGDPDQATSLAIVQAMGAAGADLLEIGVPYSDPLADGPSIVAASQRALDHGATMASVLELVAKSPIPAILFTYANPVIQYGIERLAQELAAAGGYGAIIPDLPLEETQEIAKVFARYGLELPLLVAPTTPPERAQRIVAESQGFVYLVARLGVTGAGVHLHTASIATQIATLRSYTNLPIAVGFGISKPEHVAAISEIADGAIIGSAFIDAYCAQSSPVAAAREFIATMVASTQRA